MDATAPISLGAEHECIKQGCPNTKGSNLHGISGSPEVGMRLKQ